MQYNILSDSPKRIPRKKILKLLTLIEEEEDPPDSNVNVIFVDDERIAQLNIEFRGKPGPTDVLSFNIDDDADRDSILGEIYISYETAVRNAADNGVCFTAEVLRLCCHGFLHLLGYDHERKEERHAMELKETHYLRISDSW